MYTTEHLNESYRKKVEALLIAYNFPLYVPFECYWSYATFSNRNSPSASSILSHSSRTKCLICFKLSALERIRPKMRPGVPTTMCGQFSLSVFLSLSIGIPPKKTATFRFSMYFEKRWYSFEIWKANSRVWHMAMTVGAVTGLYLFIENDFKS